MKERYEGFMRDIPCPVCEGTRLKPEILAVTLGRGGERGAKSIAEVCELSISDCADFLNALTLGSREQAIAGQVLKEIQSRLGFMLDESGWSTCPLSRAAATLSGGEAQRIRAGHPDRLGSGRGALRARRTVHRATPARQSSADRNPHALKGLGNTLIVVEHDEDTIAHADWVVDIGRAPANTAARSCTAEPTASC